jgi:SAM-dependent methyltransferase
LQNDIQKLHDLTAIYTQDPVVRRLLDAVDWPNGNRRLVEPSCGNGQFLVEAILRLVAKGFPVTSDLLVGYEVHAPAAAEARSRIVELLVSKGVDHGGATATSRDVVRTADYLTAGPSDGSFDVVIGNPPYCRWAYLPTSLQGQYAGVVPDLAQNDLLHAFLERCTRTLKPDGQLAFVTADRWLFNATAGRLREAVGQRFGLGHVERLSSQTAFYRPKQRRKGTPARVHPVIVILQRGGRALGKSPVYPGASEEDADAVRLEDVADIQLAPYTGPRGLFVVDAAKARRFPPGTCVPIVDAKELKGPVIGASTLYAIRTDPAIRPSEPVVAHLQAELNRIRSRSTGRANSRCLEAEPFWRPQESFHTWDLSLERLVVPRISPGLRCVRIPAGILPHNHGVSVVARGQLDIDTLQRVLESPEAQAWAKQRAPSVDGGFHSFMTSLLRRLPIPPRFLAT